MVDLSNHSAEQSLWLGSFLYLPLVGSLWSEQNAFFMSPLVKGSKVSPFGTGTEQLAITRNQQRISHHSKLQGILIQKLFILLLQMSNQRHIRVLLLNKVYILYSQLIHLPFKLLALFSHLIYNGD